MKSARLTHTPNVAYLLVIVSEKQIQPQILNNDQLSTEMRSWSVKTCQSDKKTLKLFHTPKIVTYRDIILHMDLTTKTRPVALIAARIQ